MKTLTNEQLRTLSKLWQGTIGHVTEAQLQELAALGLAKPPRGWKITEAGRAAHERLTNPKKLLRAPEVARRLNIHRATLDRWVERGMFPAPQPYGKRTVVWPAEQVDQWIANRREIGAPENRRLVHSQEVCKQLNISRSTLIRWVKQGYLPKPFKNGPQRNAWFADEVKRLQNFGG